jgi:hypothetical protein
MPICSKCQAAVPIYDDAKAFGLCVRAYFTGRDPREVLAAYRKSPEYADSSTIHLYGKVNGTHTLCQGSEEWQRRMDEADRAERKKNLVPETRRKVDAILRAWEFFDRLMMIAQRK